MICTHDAFTAGLTFCIILNTALLAMDKHPIDQDTQKRLELLN